MVDKEQIIAVLKTVYDPEIPVNIWDLGLVYDIKVGGLRFEVAGDSSNLKPETSNLKTPVVITMTFTSPTCPMMEELLEMVRVAVGAIAGVSDVKIELVWDPPWDISRMSEAARLELDLTEQGW